MTFTILVSLCAFMMALLGSRIIILAMRQRRLQLGYDRLPPDFPGAPPYSIQDGGIVVVFALLICVSVIDVRYSILLSMMLLLSVALLKKILPLPWFVQMLVQILAIAVPMSGFTQPTFNGVFPPWMDTLITGAIWLWFMHVFASMDRLEGLCISAMVCICMGLAVVVTLAGFFPDVLSGYSLVAVAAGCGFLWWNYPPAKIALGEVGSIPLGFFVGYLLFTAAATGYVYAALILPAYFVCDHLFAWVRRMWRSKLMQRDHDEYYYFLAISNGRSPRFVLRSIIGINLLTISLSTHAQIEQELASFHILLAYLSVMLLLGFFAHEKPTAKEPSDVQ
ncbi:MAG: hypothetical protein AB7L92_09385 [Alphaproteobacteria bacterium]